MASLIAAATFFVLLHLLVSGTRVRDAIAAKIGDGPYMGLFSWPPSPALPGWASACRRPQCSLNASYWDITPATRHVQLGLMLIAVIFIVVGLTTPNPTSVKQEGALDRPDVVKGMLRITRHPFLWGVALWAAGHLIVNGDRAGIVLFGAMLALALFGTASIDAKRKRALGPKWHAFATQTSNIPFAAILSGRQSLKIGEIGWWRIAVALVIYAALAFGHPYLFGVAALP
uniref:NnrU family protein n=1 Tax=Phenylobacterium glaciei TaxID=2803784 RepID=A0A974S922_9CAUL|nr:NnrU family protein [Phenylobacterium glaciei]